MRSNQRFAAALLRRRWVWLVLACLVLISVGGVLLVRSFTFVPDQATVPTTTCATATLAAPFSAAAEGFAAAFPCAPVRTTSTASTPFGNIQIVTYEAEHEGLNYAVSFVDYATLVPSGDLPDLLVTFILDGAKRGVLRSAKMADPTFEPITLGGYRGEAMSASDDTKVLRAHVYIVGNATYQIVSIVPKSHADPSVAAAFLDSFRVLERPATATPASN
jgi:hypothetical protein